jgi:hypothetical protein
MLNGTYPIISDAPPLPDEEHGRRKFSNGQVDNKGPARLEPCPSTRSTKTTVTETTVRWQKGVKTKEFVSSGEDNDLSDPTTPGKKDDSTLSVAESSESESESESTHTTVIYPR